MPEKQIFLSGLFLAAMFCMIFMAGKKENQGKTVAFFTYSTISAVFLLLFLHNISAMHRGTYDTDHPEPNVIHSTTSCLQYSYYAYFTAVKSGEREPHYFRKEGRCPPLQFRVSEDGTYRPVYFTQSQMRFHFQIPEPEPTVPRVKN